MAVKYFLKEGGWLFYGSKDPELALEWIDTMRVLTYMGYPSDLWVCVATLAMQS